MEHELHTKDPICMISLQQPWGNGRSEALLQVRKLALRELNASPQAANSMKAEASTIMPGIYWSYFLSATQTCMASVPGPEEHMS